MRLLAVLGASSALGDHLLRHPEHWRDLTDPTLGSTRPAAFAVRGEPAARRSAPTPRPPRRWRAATDADVRRRAAGGLPPAAAAARRPRPSHGVGVDDVAAELSDLAAGTLDAALAIARARVGEAADGAPARR